MSWGDFISMGSKISNDDVLKRTEDLELNDTSSLIYTSGTTGNPKGSRTDIQELDLPYGWTSYLFKI